MEHKEVVAEMRKLVDAMNKLMYGAHSETDAEESLLESLASLSGDLTRVECELREKEEAARKVTVTTSTVTTSSKEAGDEIRGAIDEELKKANLPGRVTVMVDTNATHPDDVRQAKEDALAGLKTFISVIKG